MEKRGYVYMLASQRYGTLYIGVSSDLVKRIWELRQSVVDGFTTRYEVKRLVWYEVHDEITAAITREKQLKEWKRKWKIELIQGMNPTWRDLYTDICG